MLFHTWIFFIFFAIFYPVYLKVRGTRLMIPWLFLASYTFYGWWNPLFLILIAFSTTVDYTTVRMMHRWGRKKSFLVLSLVNNLGVLCFFKYAKFLTNNVNALLGVPWIQEQLSHIGLPGAVPVPDILLPVGISFFTFQSMSYTIDYYRGEVECEKSFLRYATFVSLFPQLVAGPIERASNLLPQIQRRPEITGNDFTDGLSLFIVGFFKKVAMADYLAVYVTAVYGTPQDPVSPENFHAPALILATLFFTWQIYFDFSGYTDMARGVGRMMGLRFMLNFNNPYTATGLGDFWNRWHLSLSTWFKDYVYIPLGGNRKGTLRTYWNMIMTMVISGFWHGASWTFIMWGALHAFGRILTRELERTRFYRDRVPRFAKQLGVFAFVSFAWIFFRANDMPHAWAIIKRIFTSGWADPHCPILGLLLILAIWAYQFTYESRLRSLLALAPVRVLLVIAMILYVAFAGAEGGAFIYFQF